MELKKSDCIVVDIPECPTFALWNPTRNYYNVGAVGAIPLTEGMHIYNTLGSFMPGTSMPAKSAGYWSPVLKKPIGKLGTDKPYCDYQIHLHELPACCGCLVMPSMYMVEYAALMVLNQQGVDGRQPQYKSEHDFYMKELLKLVTYIATTCHYSAILGTLSNTQIQTSFGQLCMDAGFKTLTTWKNRRTNSIVHTVQLTL